MKKAFFALAALLVMENANAQQRARDFGFEFGVMSPGPLNAITDVEGVKVGHITLAEDDDIRTGVTAILPHDENIFQNKIPAAIYLGNGFGKLVGYSQVKELGNLEGPIILTNTLSVAAGIEGVVDYTFSFEENSNVYSVNAVVGETNDGYLNAIRKRAVKPSHVLQAIEDAKGGEVEEGNVGAGTGTVAFGFKGGIGTASRKLPENLGGYTVGVLVQSNFGGVLTVDGLPVGKHLEQYSFKNQLESADGSIMIVIATDAPVGERNLERIAKRGMMGLAKTGGIASNGSGDYVIAFSTAKELRISHSEKPLTLSPTSTLRNDDMSALFLAAIEATEEAIINSLFAAEDMKGRDGHEVKALPINEAIKLKEKKGR
ncbi:P1 family peptidase [Litoribacter alkaliphilus]|uniref:P1 family peptidase n=1 Tax=Litoribacter ruber TaxID=702568 RepID=A0AAP2G3L8_9BACT|nr:P1 family peptidase [Litoribacter alkaliphilus]MBS9523580.1 P1 family peptidase [Litoribacter alkaliphilus]